MDPKKTPKTQRGDAHLHGVQKDRPKQKANARPAGVKNKNPVRQYTDKELQFAVNMDIYIIKYPKNHKYESRREMCKALKIPESTIRLRLSKIKNKIPIQNSMLHEISTQASNIYQKVYHGLWDFIALCP